MSPITLDVGGTHFKTSRSTLTAHPDSFFAKLLDGALPAATADDGAYFVDRDATHFRYILNFLRDGQVDVPRSLPLHHELLREARFYQLGGLQRQLEAAIAEMGGGPAAAPATRVLHVLPSMGSVTNYALSWDANVKTIQQCHLEAQRETDEMVEFVQLSNDSALTFPVAEAGKKEKTVSKWFNARLPLWRRVRELEAQGYRVAHVQSAPDGGIEFVTLSLVEAPAAAAAPPAAATGEQGSFSQGR